MRQLRPSVVLCVCSGGMKSADSRNTDKTRECRVSHFHLHIILSALLTFCLPIWLLILFWGLIYKTSLNALTKMSRESYE